MLALWRRSRLGVLVAASLVLCGIAFYTTLVLLQGSVGNVAVPPLVNLDLPQAMEELSHLGLDARVEQSDFSDRYAEGKVLAQKPLAGRSIKQGRTVFLTVSKGLRQLRMLDLFGMERALAEQILRNNGLTVERILSSCSDTSAGRVVGQTPEPGANMQRLSRIELAVSSGPCERLFLLPDYQQRPLSEVASELESAHLPFIKVESEDSGDEPVVLAQFPAPGSVVGWSDIVQLKVPRGTIQRLTRPLRLRYMRYFVPYGLSRQTLRVKSYLQNLSATEIDIQVPAGKNIELVVPVLEGLTPEVSQLPYSIISRNQRGEFE